MLAHVYEQQHVIGWYASEKLDGMRCFYDGGISRGLPTSEVPWANVEKDDRYITKPRSTGLWSRYGKAIQAPNWFLDQLPNFPLDGELWMGRGNFQKTMSTVKDLVPGKDWHDVKYMVFDSPAYFQVFGDGVLKKPKIVFKNILSWIKDRKLYEARTFKETCKFLQGFPNLLTQVQVESLDMLKDFAKEVQAKGGEGLMLRDPNSFWTPSRTRFLLKYKPSRDSEGMVIGFTWGRETDLGSKLLGKMGALIILWNGKVFKLSGFTDEEREVLKGDCKPGEVASKDCELKHFPYGTTVTFTYRELTDEGVPKEARYLRKWS